MAIGNVTIIRAVYASNDKGADVTDAVRNLIQNGNDDIPVDNQSFGDPDPGNVKYFMVWYSAPGVNDGNPIGLAATENGSIDLIPARPAPGQYSTAPQPMVAPSAGSAVSVKRAVYGTPVNGFDVTAICQALFNQGAVGVGSYSVPLTNASFGGDPDVGAGKAFAMEYWVGLSGPFFVGGKEGQTLTLQLPTGEAASAAGGAAAINVVSAG